MSNCLVYAEHGYSDMPLQDWCLNYLWSHIGGRGKVEVFPVKIAIKGEVIWLGWVFPENGNALFLTNNGCLIFSCDGKDELVREVMAVFPDAQMEIESFFDLDSAVGVAGWYAPDSVDT